MKDEDKSREQLISELEGLRRKVAALEASNIDDTQIAATLEEKMLYTNAALESINDGICVVNAHGEFLIFNRAAEEIVGIGATDVDPDLWSDQYGIFLPDEVTPVPSSDLPLVRALRGEQVEEVEVFIRNINNPDGAHIASSAYPLLFGEMSGAVLIFRNITKSKQMKEALQQSEQRYRLLVENLPNMATIVYDRDLRFVLVDGPELEATGYSKTYMEGKTLHEALPPDFANMVEPNMRAALEGKFLTAEFPWDSDSYYAYSYAPVKNRNGEVVLAMILAHNITERKHVELALSDSETRFKRLMQESPIAIQVYAPDGTLLEVNKTWERMWGVSRQAIIGKHNALQDELIKQHGIMPLIERIFDGEQVQIPDILYDPSLINLPGRKRWVRASAYHLRDENGIIQHVVLLSEDITELKAAELQRIELAVQKERIQLLEELIGDLSHDIKTPLTNINTYLYLLRGQSDPEQQREYLNILESQVERLRKLVDDILAMTRLDKGESLQFEPTDLNTTVKIVSGIYNHLIQKNELHLILDLSPDLPPVFANEAELSRSIGNLLENAVNYTPGGGTITLRTYAQGGESIIEVLDTGIGISETELPRVFDRFYRTDQARSTNQGGTGLGLAIAKKIIQLHHGKIEVHSVEGEGTQFDIHLPLIASL